MNDSKLTYFTRSEFDRNGRNWFDDMCPSLLVRLDVLRNMWKAPIRISPHPDAIGREDNSDSQHNIRKWGEVRAVDVFPDIKELGLPFGDNESNNAIEFFDLAEQVGFHGLGIYPDVHYNGERRFMAHLDTGTRKATWSRINGKYTDFEAGIKWLEENG